jgi:hypothetical protein
MVTGKGNEKVGRKQIGNKRKGKTMADAKTPATATDDEFVMVSTGSAEPENKIIFEVIGDSFTGTYLGMRKMENADGNYQQARFEKSDGIYFVNVNYSLREGLKTVRTGSKTRITYVEDLDTGQASPMRVYTVEVARTSRAVRASSS